MMCSFVCRTSPPQDDTRASTSCRSMPRMMNVGRSSSTSFNTRHVVELHPPCHHAVRLDLDLHRCDCRAALCKPVDVLLDDINLKVEATRAVGAVTSSSSTSDSPGRIRLGSRARASSCTTCEPSERTQWFARLSWFVKSWSHSRSLALDANADGCRGSSGQSLRRLEDAELRGAPHREGRCHRCRMEATIREMGRDLEHHITVRSSCPIELAEIPGAEALDPCAAARCSNRRGRRSSWPTRKVGTVIDDEIDVRPVHSKRSSELNHGRRNVHADDLRETLRQGNAQTSDAAPKVECGAVCDEPKRTELVDPNATCPRPSA